MTITRQQFKDAKSGDKIINANGKELQVRSPVSKSSDLLSILVRYGDGPRHEVYFLEGQICNRKLDPIPELNGDNVRFVTQE
jgi:hypothetical protein